MVPFVADSVATSDRRPKWRASQTKWWSSSSQTTATITSSLSEDFRPASLLVRLQHQLTASYYQRIN